MPYVSLLVTNRINSSGSLRLISTKIGWDVEHAADTSNAKDPNKSDGDSGYDSDNSSSGHRQARQADSKHVKLRFDYINEVQLKISNF